MSENETGEDSGTTEQARKWEPLGTHHRRVLGTLIEKAKTTDTYPMSLNALTNGCNQKSNRDPQMSLEPHRVEEILEDLRNKGAVAEVQGDSRVAKYRHYAYDWLGVDKYEIAVMAELLLRGSQTLGELRGRAARMEGIADVAALRPIIDALMQKKLVISLTPAGRGQIVTHSLYLPEQLEKVKRSAGNVVASSVSTPEPSSFVAPTSTNNASDSSGNGAVAELRAEVSELRSEVTRLKSEIEDLWQSIRG